MKRPLIVLTGPTAAGKTKLSIALAKAINGEIISADSAQVYKYMNIGSAKIKKEEMSGVQHYLVDILEPTQDFNIVLFQKYAKEAVEKIYAKGKIPILVGGTGFYIQSVLYDIDFENSDEDSNLRSELENLAKEKGNDYVHNILKEIDPESAEIIHANNVKRVIRAIEYYRQTGQKISEHNETEKQKESAYDSFYFVLTDEREKLYANIDKRVDIMIECDDTTERVEHRVKDKCLQRSFLVTHGGWNTLNHSVQDILDTKAGLSRRLNDVFSVATNEVDDFILHLLGHCVYHIALVHHRNNLKTMVNRHVEVRDSLCLDTLCGINH